MQEKEIQERLKRQDVKLLLTQLMTNEEAMIKLILERLYDTGTGNWIERKVRFRRIKPGLRLVARCAKPAGRYLGYKWMVKNTPRLITAWLFSQVAFKPPKSESEPIEVQAAPVELLASQQKQINQLQKRLRLTSSVAVIAVISTGGLLLVQNTEVLTKFMPQPSSATQTRILSD